MKVLILVGGESAEREVSLNSGKAVAAAFKDAGHRATMLDVGSDRRELELVTSGVIEGQSVASASDLDSAAEPPTRFTDYDCVFIALHGGSGEDGTLQALLDLAGVCYTGSGVRGSAIAMDKYRSKLILNSVGIPTPEMIFFGNLNEALAAYDSWPLPLVVKPNSEGSTVGLSIVRERSELRPALELAAKYDAEILVEAYIAGRELTVTILGDEALPVVEIVPKSGFYDYKAKYTAGETEYICPAKVSESVTRQIQEFSLMAFSALGCDGYARVDFRMDEQEKLYCLEANTAPGMTATSLVPKAAHAAGMSFAQLLERIVELARDKHRR